MRLCGRLWPPMDPKELNIFNSSAGRSTLFEVTFNMFQGIQHFSRKTHVFCSSQTGRFKRGRTQKHANKCKRAHMRAKEHKRKSAKESKRAFPRKTCKQPGFKQSGLGSANVVSPKAPLFADMLKMLKDFASIWSLLGSQ